MAIDLNGSTGISLDDNEKINIGNDSDLQIYHDGSNSYITDQGTGNLRIRGTSIELSNADGSKRYGEYLDGDAVKLYHNGSKKFETTSTGVDVTGTVTSDGLTVSTSASGFASQITNNNDSSQGLQVRTSDNDGGQFILDLQSSSSATGTDYASKFVVTKNGDVGIGTDSPSGKLQVETSGTVANLYVRSDISTSALASRISLGNSTSASRFTLGLLGGGGEIAYLGPEGSFPLYFQTNGAERMRLDSSGNFLVGTTTVNAFGATFREGSKYLYLNRDGGEALFVDRASSDGGLIALRRGGTNIGLIGVDASNYPTIDAQAANTIGLQFGAYVQPRKNRAAQDNFVDLGSGSFRFDDIYASNGTIQTSDFNEKQDIASLTATEMLVGKRISALFKTFRWKDKVVEKGDNARTHTGVIAQDVQAAFTAEGLDVGDYALFISTTWWTHDVDVPAVEAVAEVTDEDGNITTEAVEAVDAYTRTDTYEIEDEAPEGATSKTRLGIRYPELLSFVAAYNEQRFASIEARLTALEA